MTTREELHRIVDEIPEDDANQLLTQLRIRYRPVSMEEVNQVLDDIATRVTKADAPPLSDRAVSREGLYE